MQVILNGCCAKLKSALERIRGMKFRTWKQYTMLRQSFRHIKYFSLNLNEQSWNLSQIFPKSDFSFLSCS